MPYSDDYIKAIQNPRRAFEHPRLRDCAAVPGLGGMPWTQEGGNAVVLKVSSGNAHLAIKAFKGDVDRIPEAERFRAVFEEFRRASLPFLLEAEFVVRGVRLSSDNKWYPVVIMQWGDGVPLEDWISSNILRPDSLFHLARSWRDTVTSLRARNVAHGDLREENVQVTRDGQLLLVDYDGSFVPALAGMRAIERGHANWAHPERVATNAFGPWLDDFPATVGYLSLLAIAADPTVWKDYYRENSESLIFSLEDYRNPSSSRVFKRLSLSANVGIRAIAADLATWCKSPIGSRTFADIVMRHPHDALRCMQANVRSQPAASSRDLDDAVFPGRVGADPRSVRLPASRAFAAPSHTRGVRGTTWASPGRAGASANTLTRAALGAMSASLVVAVVQYFGAPAMDLSIRLSSLAIGSILCALCVAQTLGVPSGFLALIFGGGLAFAVGLADFNHRTVGLLESTVAACCISTALAVALEGMELRNRLNHAHAPRAYALTLAVVLGSICLIGIVVPVQGTRASGNHNELPIVETAKGPEPEVGSGRQVPAQRGQPSDAASSATQEGSTPHVTPAPPTLLGLHTTPAGVLVRIDDVNVGETPVLLNVAVGSHRLELSKEGYDSVTRPIYASGERLELHESMSRERVFSIEGTWTGTYGDGDESVPLELTLSNPNSEWKIHGTLILQGNGTASHAQIVEGTIDPSSRTIELNASGAHISLHGAVQDTHPLVIRGEAMNTDIAYSRPWSASLQLR